jgi:hypothetical protein
MYSEVSRTPRTQILSSSEHYIPDKATRNAVLLLVQEIKRDIISRRMNLPQSAQQITHLQRLTAYLGSSIRRLQSYLQYIGILKYSKPMEAIQWLRQINLEWTNIVNLYHAFAQCYHDNSYLSLGLTRAKESAQKRFSATLKCFVVGDVL